MGYFFNTLYPLFVSLLLGYKTFVLLLKNIAKRIDITHIYICVQILKQFMMCYGIYILFYKIV